MALPGNIRDREHAKFRETATGETAVAVTIENAAADDSVREATVLTNLITLQLLGISLDNYVTVGDEVISDSAGHLIKADEA